MRDAPLTPKQIKVLNFIIKFLNEHKYTPTLMEIAAYLGIKVPGTFEHIQNLVEAGYLKKLVNANHKHRNYYPTNKKIRIDF